MKAHELLSDSSKWTQGCSAETQEGLPIRPTDPLAARWCLVGALSKVSYSRRGGEWDGAFLAKIEKIRMAGIAIPSTWNDKEGRTFEEVHKLLVKLDL
jgi:hypothetical protein